MTPPPSDDPPRADAPPTAKTVRRRRASQAAPAVARPPDNLLPEHPPIDRAGLIAALAELEELSSLLRRRRA